MGEFNICPTIVHKGLPAQKWPTPSVVFVLRGAKCRRSLSLRERIFLIVQSKSWWPFHDFHAGSTARRPQNYIPPYFHSTCRRVPNGCPPAPVLKYFLSVLEHSRFPDAILGAVSWFSRWVKFWSLVFVSKFLSFKARRQGKGTGPSQ